jgi:hypothetical protein
VSRRESNDARQVLIGCFLLAAGGSAAMLALAALLGLCWWVLRWSAGYAA